MADNSPDTENFDTQAMSCPLFTPGQAVCLSLRYKLNWAFIHLRSQGNRCKLLATASGYNTYENQKSMKGLDVRTSVIPVSLIPFRNVYVCPSMSLSKTTYDKLNGNARAANCSGNAR